MNTGRKQPTKFLKQNKRKKQFLSSISLCFSNPLFPCLSLFLFPFLFLYFTHFFHRTTNPPDPFLKPPNQRRYTTKLIIRWHSKPDLQVRKMSVSWEGRAVIWECAFGSFARRKLFPTSSLQWRAEGGRRGRWPRAPLSGGRHFPVS